MKEKLSKKQVFIINQTLEDYVGSYKLAHNKTERGSTDYYCYKFLDEVVKDVNQRGVFMEYYNRHKMEQ